MAYFERVDDSTYRATEHVSGAWKVTEQHIAPALGLLAHVVESDRDGRGRDDLVIGRVSYDILGVLPIDTMQTSVRVLRPGRTIELVEARLRHDDRDAVILRAWLMRPQDRRALAGTSFPRIPSLDDTPEWNPSSVWGGGFIASLQGRRTQVEPGRATFWLRTPLPLVGDQKVSSLARVIGLLDAANGMTVRVDPSTAVFPNLDLTAHFFDKPRGEWVGFDTTVSFGAAGIGLTSSVIHDADGPVGTVNQILTVRP